MGKSKKLKNFVEKPLLSSSMLGHCLIEEVKGVKSGIHCRIENFSSFENFDQRKVVLHDMEVSCRRYKYDLRIWFSHKNVNCSSVEIYLIKTDGNRVIGATDKKGLDHVAAFSLEMIQNPVKKLLQDDKLTIECIFSTRPLENNIVLMPSSRETTNECMHNYDADMLLNDFRHLYLSSDLYDFVIKFQNAYFKAHKLILRISSDYFKDLFCTNPDCESTEVHIEGNPLAMNKVLLYSYSGEFRNNDSIDFTLEILCIADKLKFGKLTQLCIQTLKSTFNYCTVNVYLIEAQKRGLESLIKAIKEFFEELPGLVLQTKEWKHAYETAIGIWP